MEEHPPAPLLENGPTDNATVHPVEEDEAALVERVKAGEIGLFLRLIQPHEKTLRSVCHAILRDESDAEEVIQETFLKAISHINQLKANLCFRGWLLQIAVNEARQRLRRQRLYPSEPILCEEAAEVKRNFTPEQLVEWRQIPSLEMERKETQAAIRRALCALEGIYREVLVLRDIHQFSTDQTSMILEISPACVMTRLHRARLQMRERLTPFFARPQTGWITLNLTIDRSRKFMRRMMRCQRLIGELSNYIDGSLDPDACAKIDRHLKLCRTCWILVDSLRKLIYIVGDGEVFVPPIHYSELTKEFRSEPAAQA